MIPGGVLRRNLVLYATGVYVAGFFLPSQKNVRSLGDKPSTPQSIIPGIEFVKIVLLTAQFLCMERSLKAASLFCVALAGVAAPLQTPTAQDMADAILYARGGTSRIQNIKTERMAGRVNIGDHQGTFVREVMRPNKIRMEVTLNGETTIMGYNGTTGWKRQISANGTQNTKLSPDENKKMAEDADIDGLFMSYADKGVTIEPLDKEMLGPSVVWKVKVTPKVGSPEFYYIESTGHYILMRENTRIEDSKPVIFESIYKNFRRVEGVLFPFTVVSLTQDGKEMTTLQFDTIQLNSPIDASAFDQPAAGKGK